MEPAARYQSDLSSGFVTPDTAQERVVARLQQLHDQILQRQQVVASNWVKKLYSRILGTKQPDIKGIYLWGDVGRGKTYLMDVFFDSLPITKKHRTHFHRFMQNIHQQLEVNKDTQDPLLQVADSIAENNQVICFDEFYVSDIGDAMILARLLDRLLARDVVFVMTSNTQPRSLYLNGLQRERFLPAIELLGEHFDEIELTGDIDYRLRQLQQAKLYHWPVDSEAEATLKEVFQQLAPDSDRASVATSISILGRDVACRCCVDDVIWFDFDQLCATARSAFDYIEIAHLYHALLLSHVKQLDDSQNDQVRRFINLIDELYDRCVKLIVYAEVDIKQLYVGKLLQPDFKRTMSRLIEMQSLEYLSRAHKP